MAETSEKRRIVSEKWYLGETLGKGGYGFVKCGYHVKNNKPFALKFMKKDTKQGAEDQAKMVTTEINALKKVSSPYVLRLFAYNLRCKYPNKDGTSMDTILLVLELAPGGELFDILFYADKLEEKVARTYFSQLAQGLKAIHDAGICHRDLKPQNLLLNKRFQLKITDFGLSKIFSPENSNGVMTTTYVGTKGFQAPELLLNRKYTDKCDIFSCGVILFILLTGYPPLESAMAQDNWYRKIAQKKYDVFWKKHEGCGIDNNEPVKALIQSCLAYQPMDRLSTDGMIAHEWTQKELCSKEELEQKMRKLHDISIKKKKNDARKMNDLQNSFVKSKVAKGNPQSLTAVPVIETPPYRSVYVLSENAMNHMEKIMPTFEGVIEDCQGTFKKRSEDAWHLIGHVTGMGGDVSQIEVRVFRVSNKSQTFIYLHNTNPVSKISKRYFAQVWENAGWILGERVEFQSPNDDVDYDDFDEADFEF